MPMSTMHAQPALQASPAEAECTIRVPDFKIYNPEHSCCNSKLISGTAVHCCEENGALKKRAQTNTINTAATQYLTTMSSIFQWSIPFFLFRANADRQPKLRTTHNLYIGTWGEFQKNPESGTSEAEPSRRALHLRVLFGLPAPKRRSPPTPAGARWPRAGGQSG